MMYTLLQLGRSRETAERVVLTREREGERQKASIRPQS